MKKRSGLLFGLFLLTAFTASAQFTLPQIDIEFKAGYAKIDAGGNGLIDNADFSPLHGGLHVQFNQRLAIGGFYSRGSGQVQYKQGNQGSIAQDLKTLAYGVDLRLSAGRSVKWRPYLGLVYGKIEMVENLEGINLAASSNMMGINAGVMLRFGRNFYWTVLEVSPRYIPDKIFFLNSDFMIEGKTGFLYNIRFKTK